VDRVQIDGGAVETQSHAENGQGESRGYNAPAVKSIPRPFKHPLIVFGCR
jgi:hypothetical protein